MLSTEAGAYDGLGGPADAIHRFDLVATAAAMGAALDRDGEERRRRAEQLRTLVEQRTPADWLADQLAAAV